MTCTHLDLALHGDGEEDDEVHDEDGPEHRHVQRLEKRTDEGYHDGFKRAVPTTQGRETSFLVHKAMQLKPATLLSKLA